MEELFGFIAFVVNVLFFLWLGSRLNGIYDESRRTNALLNRTNELLVQALQVEMRSYLDRGESLQAPPPLPTVTP